MNTQYLGPPKVKGIEDSSSEQEDEKQRHDQAKKELTYVAQKAAQFYEKNMLKTISINNRNAFISKGSTMFPFGFVATAPTHSKRSQKGYEGDSRLALRLAIVEYLIAEPKSNINVLSRRYSISYSTLRRYREVMMIGSQYI